MERRGAFLNGIARTLNAGGSALVSIYDTVASIGSGVTKEEQGNIRAPVKKTGGPDHPKTPVKPVGERDNLAARIREYEKKMEQLYYEIGREVAQQESTTQIPAAAEASIQRVAEFRVEIEKIGQRIRELEEKERTAAAKPDATGEKAEPAAADAAVVEEGPTIAAMEEVQESPAEAAEATETTEPELLSEITEHPLPPETVEFEAPESGEASPIVAAEGPATSVGLTDMLKEDLLKICRKKGIKANRRMTKVDIVKLILGC